MQPTRRVASTLSLAALFATLSLAQLGNASSSSAHARSAAPSLASAQQKRASMSIPFVPNGGQWDSRAAFAAQTFAGTLFVTTEGQLVYSLPGRVVGADFAALPRGGGKPSDAKSSPTTRTPGWALTETLVDARGQARLMTQSSLKDPAGDRPMDGKVSYATAQNTGSLNTYERVNLGEMYPGINVQLRAAHSNAGNNVEKIFTVAPQHDPKQIRIKLAGAEKLEINGKGELIAHTGNGPVAFTAPIAFQEIDQGERVMVDVAYQLVGTDAAALPHPVGADAAALSGARPSDAKSSPTDRATTYTFTLGAYDTTRPLVIDPLLASTYLGGTGEEQINAIAVHPHSGQVYVAGETESQSFPQAAYVTGAVGSELCIATQPGVCVTPYVGCASPCFSTGWFPGPWDFLSGDYIAVRHTSAASGTSETKLIISGSAYPFRSSTGNANIACSLDMNGDNVLTATVEGLILVRAMLGFGGNAAVAGTGITPFAWENTLRPALNQHCGTNFPFTPIL